MFLMVASLISLVGLMLLVREGSEEMAFWLLLGVVAEELILVVEGVGGSRLEEVEEAIEAREEEDL